MLQNLYAAGDTKILLTNGFVQFMSSLANPIVISHGDGKNARVRQTNIMKNVSDNSLEQK